VTAADYVRAVSGAAVPISGAPSSVAAGIADAWTASVPYARALDDPARPLVLRTVTGRALVLDAARFTAPPDPVDRSVLDRCHGPTLDLGCGPGRLVAELGRRGVPALGVDVSPAAVRLGRAAGAVVLRRSVFDRLPGTGRWSHALLMDGNIGIGGDPAALLARARDLVRPGTGEVVVETDPEDVHEDHVVTFDDGNGEPFGWSRIGTEALTPIAARLGFRVAAGWTAPGGRRFVALAGPDRRPAPPGDGLPAAPHASTRSLERFV
jgi:SAM-dependent methyltransferase